METNDDLHEYDPRAIVTYVAVATIVAFTAVEIAVLLS